MLFSTLTFLIYFLPIFLLVYYILPAQGSFRNVWFLVASLAFYFWGEQEYILLLLLSITLNYFVGINLDRKPPNKFLLAFGVGTNLLLLLYFKYAFFITNSMGLANENSYWNNIHLPLGISFFTFQSISYLIDIYRKEVPAEQNPINLACYICMFPQLVAGPIVRYKTIAQSIQKRQIKPEQVAYGIILFIIGLSYKILIANNLAQPVDELFALPAQQLTPSLAWAAALGYTYQIYFDFCGYSTMAVGLGLMLGFRFPHNFNFPYVANSLTDFWRRWHITLSSWFRDYLYIPLGGNRKGNSRLYLNLLIVFILCGLWHGAAWNFLFWGLFHGLFLVLERLGLIRLLQQLPRLLRQVYSMLVVIIGWVFFRANSFDQALIFLKTMLGFEPKAAVKFYSLEEFTNPIVIMIFLFAVILASPVVNKLIFYDKNTSQTICQLQEMPAHRLGLLWYVFIGICFLLCYLSLINQSYNPFIYFRF